VKNESTKDPTATGSFGSATTDHYLYCDYSPEGSWTKPTLAPLGDISLSLNSVVFHYGQQIFEGLKAYRAPQGEVYLFRPQENAQRFFGSAVRLAMAPVPPELFLECVTSLVSKENCWVPKPPGTLYIRPFLIPLDRGISYRASKSYRFCVIVSPVASYYAKSATGVTVAVERTMARAAPGGVGDIKCGGNYAGALLAQAKARALGAVDVMWLDAVSHQYVEEIGTMNVMFYYDNRLVTPSLSGTILPGITRKSLLELAQSMGVEVKEQKMTIDQIFADREAGKLKEVFGCGTAVVVNPIQMIIDGERSVEFDISPTSFAQTLKERLQGIQFKTLEDPFNWCYRI
jgi:branched-chain amino acid aminotransferase